MPDIFISPEEETKKEEQAPPETYVSRPKRKVPLEKLYGHTHNPLTSYAYLPERINFETKEKEEKVVLLLRRHAITNLRWIFIATAMVFVPFVLTLLLKFDFIPGEFRLIGVLAWYLVIFAYILENFLNWFFNVYVITDERVVDIDFVNLIYKEVSDANIDKIQDVTYKMGGVSRSMFNYGDVLIQTASEIPNFEFLAVPSPDKIAKILQDLRIEERQEEIEGRIR
jgi:hypothetical protein